MIIEARGLFFPIEILALISLGAEEKRERWCNHRLLNCKKDIKTPIDLDGIFTRAGILSILDRTYGYRVRTGKMG